MPGPPLSALCVVVILVFLKGRPSRFPSLCSCAKRLPTNALFIKFSATLPFLYITIPQLNFLPLCEVSAFGSVSIHLLFPQPLFFVSPSTVFLVIYPGFLPMETTTHPPPFFKNTTPSLNPPPPRSPLFYVSGPCCISHRFFPGLPRTMGTAWWVFPSIKLTWPNAIHRTGIPSPNPPSPVAESGPLLFPGLTSSRSFF